MMKTIVMEGLFLRHGMTRGNEEGRYIGRTDEPLSDNGRKALAKIEVPDVTAVFASPMKRCLETAGLLYPDKDPIVIDGFQECDFGDFEYRTAEEMLAKDPRYRAWVESGGEMAFPGGESLASFQERSCAAFLKSVAMAEEKRIDRAAYVFHGGSIMAILGMYGVPRRPYYEFQVKNGGGYRVSIQIVWGDGSDEASAAEDVLAMSGKPLADVPMEIQYELLDPSGKTTII